MVVTNGQFRQCVSIEDIPAGIGFDLMNVYQAGAYAMYRHGGGVSGTTLTYFVDLDENAEDGFNPNNKTVTINRWNRKFVIVHEAGHWMSDKGTHEVMNQAGDCSYTDAVCGGSPHWMLSEEWAGCAADEGFSHFYAADVWNNHNELDCEFGSEPFDLHYLNTNCGGTAQHGVELDWLRQFWDVHTNGNAPDPTFTAMINWLDDAPNWTRSNVYSKLDQQADVVGGDLNTNWDAMKGAVGNGINH